MHEYLAIKLVKQELTNATSSYPSFHSAHEGLAVIEEEFFELMGEVFLHPRERSQERMKQEAIQLAAMALRFIIDLT